MNVQFDRILDSFDGPFEKLADGIKPPEGIIKGPANPAGYLLSHRVNNSFILVNRLLQKGCEVYWLKSPMEVEGRQLGAGAIWVPANASAREVLESGTKELGLSAYAVVRPPTGDVFKLKPVRIGLVDQYGGSIPAGWLRYVFEQFEFPYETVFPKTLDEGDLVARYDVLVFMDDAIHAPAGVRRGGATGQPAADTIPEEYRPMLGRITNEKTTPRVRKFIEAGGNVITVGGSHQSGRLAGPAHSGRAYRKIGRRHRARVATRQILCARFDTSGNRG